MIGNYIGSAIETANEYVETLNLFEVSYGKYTERMHEWTNNISDTLGLDPSEIKRYAATYQDLASALGVTSEQALTISKNMTQLTYDIASLKNLSFEKSF